MGSYLIQVSPQRRKWKAMILCVNGTAVIEQKWMLDDTPNRHRGLQKINWLGESAEGRGEGKSLSVAWKGCQGLPSTCLLE